MGVSCLSRAAAVLEELFPFSGRFLAMRIASFFTCLLAPRELRWLSIGAAPNNGEPFQGPFHGSCERCVSLARYTWSRLWREDKCPDTAVVRFEWGPRKAKANLKAHRVSFAEAVTVLEDDFALSREDPDVEELRYVTLGLSNLANLLVVVYSYREPDVIRVISAWKASKGQRRQYEKARG